MRQRLASSARVRTTRLPVARASRPPAARFARHPGDGWQLAEPYPMGAGARRALRAVIEALCPAPPAPWPAGATARIELSARRFMRYMDPIVARALWLAVLVLDWAPLLALKSPRRLHRLGREHAARILRSLAASRFFFVRMLVFGVRGLVLSLYFDQDEVHAAMGYAPVPFIRERIALRERLLAAKPADTASGTAAE